MTTFKCVQLEKLLSEGKSILVFYGLSWYHYSHFELLAWQEVLEHTNTSIGRFENYEQSGGSNGIDPATRSYVAVVDRSFPGQQIPISVISEGILPHVVSMGQGRSRSHRKALQSLDIHQCPAM